MKFIFRVVLIFLIIYDINLQLLPGLTTARLVFVFLVFKIAVLKGRLEIPKGLANYSLFLLIFFGYSFLLSAMSGDFTQTARLFYFTLYVGLGSYLVSEYFQRPLDFAWVGLIAVTAQSVIIITAFFLPSLRLFISQLVEIDANFDFSNLYRSFGLTSASGSALGVIQGCGAALGLYVFYKAKLGMGKLVLVVISILLCLASTLVTGRTGLLIFGLALGAYLIISGVSAKLILQIVVFILLIIVLNPLEFFLNQTTGIRGFSTEFFRDWIFNAFSLSNNQNFNNLDKMSIPPLRLENFVFGTGEVINKYGTNASGHDSGFIQTYYALGFLPTILFYLGTSCFLIKFFNKNARLLSWFVVGLLLLLEVKEPFLFKYSLGFLSISLLWTFYRNHLNNNQEHVRDLRLE